MSVDYSQFLAKSRPEVGIKKHIEDCLCIGKQLQECIPNIPLSDTEIFWEMLHIAVIMHDIGKAHIEFQALLHGLKNDWHHQRHELFSLIFIDGLQLPKEQKELVIASLVKFVERVSNGKEVCCVSKEEIEILPAISEILLKTKQKVIT